MKKARYISLVLRALYLLMRYDLMVSLCDSGCILQNAQRQPVAQRQPSTQLEQAVCDAVLLATCFYWKPVLCLQRAVSTVTLLRKHGIAARLMIGYRPAPFFSHAWVEVDGRVVYGSPAYKRQLKPLFVA
jgi:hypothetical protein